MAARQDRVRGEENYERTRRAWGRGVEGEGRNEKGWDERERGEFPTASRMEMERVVCAGVAVARSPWRMRKAPHLPHEET